MLDLVSDIIGIDRGSISADTSRESAEQWDSMNHLRLITAVEESYSVRLSMDEIENIHSVADLTTTLERHLSQ